MHHHENSQKLGKNIAKIQKLHFRKWSETGALASLLKIYDVILLKKKKKKTISK